MTQVFKHPAGAQLLISLREIFQEKRVFIRDLPFIVFVCGGRLDNGLNSLRKQFLVWAQHHLPGFICMLPELALEDNFVGEGRSFVNLTEFESVVADVSDCVLIFAESVGSFAEIGFFSQSKNISRKTLVANLLHHQAEESFLNKGPIDTISGRSFLKPTILIANAVSPDFTDIGQRLKERVKRPHYRERLPYKTFGQFNYKQKLLVVFQVIKLLLLADLTTLRYVIINCFGGKPQKQELIHLLRILIAAGFIERNSEYFRVVGRSSLIDIDHVEVERVAAQFQFFYQKHFEELYNVLAADGR